MNEEQNEQLSDLLDQIRDFWQTVDIKHRVDILDELRAFPDEMEMQLEEDEELAEQEADVWVQENRKLKAAERLFEQGGPGCLN